VENTLSRGWESRISERIIVVMNNLPNY